MRYQRRHRTGLARATRIGRAFRGLGSKPDRPREQRHFGVVPQHAHRQALGPSRTGRGGTDITTAIWKAGTTAYRRDLDTEDPYGESAHIDIDLGHQFRSIVEGALLPRAPRRQQRSTQRPLTNRHRHSRRRRSNTGSRSTISPWASTWPSPAS